MGGSGTNGTEGITFKRRTKCSKAEDVRSIVQKCYNRLFNITIENQGALKKGVEPLSYRPRVYIGARKDIERVLGGVESFLKEHHPGVEIPPKPRILR